ncbi:MAG: histidine phosphatase family protein [Lentisphaeria bacterium]|nr:histidine phosphatase family protein [Lentisphaeria bacterium]NQZ66495.1 histidine phosphatase family protein [Lentisphaeria bacterium]
MKLILIYHADAHSKEDSDVSYDAERPLTELGQRQSEKIAEYLKANQLNPSPIVCSPFVRTQETATIICAAIGYVQQAIPLIILAPGCSIEDILRAALNYGDTENQWMLAVLHEPDMLAILSEILCHNKSFPWNLEPGDLFAVELEVNQGHYKTKLIHSYSVGTMETHV